jgi:hypothetical protein
MSKICSYGEFQDLKLPYQHAIAAISHGKYPIRPYISDLYLKETYKNTYKALFSPIDTSDLIRDKDCGPCNFQR